jgi:hypothetical protein
MSDVPSPESEDLQCHEQFDFEVDQIRLEDPTASQTPFSIPSFEPTNLSLADLFQDDDLMS